MNSKPTSQIAALMHQLDMAAAMIAQQKRQIQTMSETIRSLSESRPLVNMTESALWKLTIQERSHLIAQVGPIELIG